MTDPSEQALPFSEAARGSRIGGGPMPDSSPHGSTGADPYARCRECGSRNVEGIAAAHAVGRVNRHGMVTLVTHFEESEAQADPASLMCGDCGSWDVRPPEALRTVLA